MGPSIPSAVAKGLYDSVRGMVAIFYLDKEINERAQKRSTFPSTIRQRQSPSICPPRKAKTNDGSKIVQNLLQCALLNGGVYLLSVLIFEYILLPGIGFMFICLFSEDSFVTAKVWSWVKDLMVVIFQTAWLVPLFLLSKIINTLWFQDIANSAFRHTRGRPVPFPSRAMYFADSVFSAVVQSLFLLQATLTSYIIPIYPLGQALYTVQMALLYSLYSFEYKWFNLGWVLDKRLSFLEENMPYFIGFGLPLALLTQISNSWLINGCVFSIIFPLFIISGNQATPALTGRTFNLHLFALAMAATNIIFFKTIRHSMKNVKPAVPVS
ncbi:etoposide-induced protein 2.4 homolog [Dendroctonus ponderosae]